MTRTACKDQKIIIIRGTVKSAKIARKSAPINLGDLYFAVIFAGNDDDEVATHLGWDATCGVVDACVVADGEAAKVGRKVHRCAEVHQVQNGRNFPVKKVSE